MAGEPLPAVGGSALAQAVPELRGEAVPCQQHRLREVEQIPEVGVLLDGLGERVSAGPALWVRRREG